MLRVFRESIGVVVHYTQSIIRFTSITIVIHLKIVLFTGWYIGPIYLNMQVPIRARLFMSHSNCMSKLMKGSAYAQTSWNLELQALRLFLRNHAHVRVTSFCRVVLHENCWTLLTALHRLMTCRRATEPTNINEIDASNSNVKLVTCCQKEVPYMRRYI